MLYWRLANGYTHDNRKVEFPVARMDDVMDGSYYRILMFAPAFAPFANAEAIVNSKLVLAMLDAGWAVDVISRNLSGMSTYDYGTTWSEPWLSLKKHTHEITYPVGNKLNRFADALWSAAKVRYPLDGCRWVARAYDLAISLQQVKKYDVILSRAFPSYAHIPALRVAQKTGLPWLANWNDPWDFLRQHQVLGNLRENIGVLNAFFTRKISSSASWHTFPSDKLREIMICYLGGESKNRSSTIPHVVLPNYRRFNYVEDDIFRICFCGHLGKYQNPSTFLEGFAYFLKNKEKKNKFYIIIAGIDDVGVSKIACHYGIHNNIHYAGKLSYLDSLQLIAKSDVLLAIDPPDVKGILLTSKFVDYVQSGRPILAITTKESTLDHVLNRYGGGISVDHSSPSNIAMALEEFYSHWKNGDLENKSGSDKLLRLFSHNAILTAYKQIIIDLSDETI